MFQFTQPLTTLNLDNWTVEYTVYLQARWTKMTFHTDWCDVDVTLPVAVVVMGVFGRAIWTATRIHLLHKDARQIWRRIAMGRALRSAFPT